MVVIPKLKPISKQLLIGAGCVGLLSASYAMVKLVRKYQATLPRANADAYLQVGPLKRAYNLYVPESYTGKKAVPLVLAFHAVGGDGKGMEEMTGFNPIADREGFIVAYPDAIAKHWDARRSMAPEITNDVGFISALIDDLSQRYQIDPNRIYVTGFSNGATFAHRLGCELSDKISAIAAVASSMPSNLARTCKPTKPLSVLLINGTDDEAFPYKTAGKALLTLSDTVQFWADQNRCPAPTKTQVLPNNAHVQLDAYAPCVGQTRVMLYTIKGGEHSWGDDSITGADRSVKPNQALNESSVIWNFFKQQPKTSQ